MKLRNIILGAVAAMAFTASFTSCSKDNDDDVNVYGEWRVLSGATLPVGFSAGYLNLQKDSLASYAMPNEAGAYAYGLSTDSVYLLVEKIAVKSVVCNSDSALVTAVVKDTDDIDIESELVFKPLTDGTYVMLSADRKNQVVLKRVSGLKFADRIPDPLKEDDDD